MRVMCDQISGVACAQRDSSMGSFIGQVRSAVELDIATVNTARVLVSEVGSIIIGHAHTGGYALLFSVNVRKH